MNDVSNRSERQWVEPPRDLEDERREQRRLWRAFGISIAGLIFMLVVISVLLP